jgi:cytochrome c553
MENPNEKQTKEQTQEEKQQIQNEPVAENLSDAELDKVAGGAHYSTTKSQVKSQ